MDTGLEFVKVMAELNVGLPVLKTGFEFAVDGELHWSDAGWTSFSGHVRNPSISFSGVSLKWTAAGAGMTLDIPTRSIIFDAGATLGFIGYQFSVSGATTLENIGITSASMFRGR